MELDKIGAVLRKRIKECNYTQEEFANRTGVGLSSLKKYMSGKNAYDIEILKRFASELKCSYDYLLGDTETPQLEHQDIKKTTLLSDGSIERLMTAAQDEDMMLIHVFDYLLQNDKLVGCAQDYISIQLHEAAHHDEPEDERYIMLNDRGVIENSMRLGDYRLRAPELSDVYLSGMMTAFVDNLKYFGKNVSCTKYYFKGQKIKR